MTDFSELKVAELKEQLKARSLPTSGNKAELVRRLEDSESQGPANSDGSSETQQQGSATVEATAEVAQEPIDRNVSTEDKPPAVAAAAAAAAAETVESSGANGQEEAVENIQEATVVPSENGGDDFKQSETAGVSEPSEIKSGDVGETAESNQATNGSNVAANEGDEAPLDEERQAQIIAELEKRAARARRFGEADDEIERQLARVKKFGAASIKPINDLSRPLSTHNRRGPNSSRRYRRGGRGYGGPGYDRRQQYDDGGAGGDDYNSGSHRDSGESSDKLEARKARFEY